LAGVFAGGVAVVAAAAFDAGVAAADAVVESGVAAAGAAAGVGVTVPAPDDAAPVVGELAASGVALGEATEEPAESVDGAVLAGVAGGGCWASPPPQPARMALVPSAARTAAMWSMDRFGRIGRAPCWRCVLSSVRHRVGGTPTLLILCKAFSLPDYCAGVACI
jgi:hypothetical protein